VTFVRDEVGALVARRGAGGLVSGLAPLFAGTDRLWVAAAMSDADRAAAHEGPVDADGLRVLLVDVAEDTFGQAYDEICNATIWPIHHHLVDLARQPRFDGAWHEAWASYRAYNQQLSAEVARVAPPDAIVLAQDYHLCLLPRMLRQERPDVVVAHFSHTPFAAPELLAVLPDAARLELLEGLAAANACGFHTARWARALTACCLAAGVDPPPTFAAPLAPDAADLQAAAASPACVAALEALDAQLDGRQAMVRVDRIEPSKNIVRGFDAYDLLLAERPDLRERVVFVASLYPSRESVPAYTAYRSDVEEAIERCNARWATSTWTPIVADLRDDFATSVAALRRADVLLVNPVRDGLNLVAFEGPLVNERDAALLLSREAGAFDVLGDAADALHPFDEVATARAMGDALDRPAAERRARADALRDAVTRRTPADWLADQLTWA
jgi:trehalose 6-phosphate synthase